MGMDGLAEELASENKDELVRGNMVIFERAAHDQPSVLRGRCDVWGFQNAKGELLTR